LPTAKLSLRDKPLESVAGGHGIEARVAGGSTRKSASPLVARTSFASFEANSGQVDDEHLAAIYNSAE